MIPHVDSMLKEFPCIISFLHCSERFVLNVLQGHDMEKVKVSSHSHRRNTFSSHSDRDLNDVWIHPYVDERGDEMLPLPQHRWAGSLGYLVRSGVAALWIDDEKREVTVDWRLANAEQIGNGMRELKSQPEYGGLFVVCDLDESKRVLASQTEAQAVREARLQLQRQDEALEQLAKLQLKVSSLEGIYGAAELGNVHVMDALIKGYPLPKYDPKSGKSIPNPDRKAIPENKTVVRSVRQLAHRPTNLQFNHATAKPAGDPMDDLRLAAPRMYEELRRGGVLQGTTCDLKDATGRTPLHFAAGAGKVAAVNMLLDSGADPNALDRDGLTPLHHAGLGGHTECLAQLVAKGGSFGVVAINGRTVLHSTCSGGHAETVKALMFDPRFKSHAPWGMMHLKTYDFDESILHYLCRSPCGSKTEQENAASTLRFLLKAWLQFCFKNPPELIEVRHTPRVLHPLCPLIAQTGTLRPPYLCVSPKASRAMLCGDAVQRIHTRDASPVCPAQSLPRRVVQQRRASQSGFWASFSSCVVWSSSYLHQVVDRNSKTVLHLCASLGNTELCRYFCSFGARVNHPCNGGDLAAHIAVRNGNAPLVLSLIASGTQMGHTNDEGESPLHIAAAIGLLGLFKMCYSSHPQMHGKKPWVWLNKRGLSAAHIVCRLSGPSPPEPDGRKGNDFFEMTRFALNNGADALMRTSVGNTLLMCCAEGGGIQAIDFIVKFTTDQEGNTPVMTSVNDMKETAVMLAARAGRTEAVLHLVNRYGCDPKQRR